MTDNVTTLPDTIEARTADPGVPDFDTNYIESGLRLSADFDAGLLAVSQGKCLHSYGGDLYYATKIERRTGDRRLSIPAGTSGVWYDFGAKEIVIGSDPGEPSLQLGTVDADAETVDGSTNRERDITSESLTTDDATINNSITYPDGTTVATSPSSGGKIQSGSFVNVMGCPAAGDNTTDTFGTRTETVVFAEAFDTVPDVVATVAYRQSSNDPVDKRLIVNTQNVSTTSVDIEVSNPQTTPLSDYSISWMAKA